MRERLQQSQRGGFVAATPGGRSIRARAAPSRASAEASLLRRGRVLATPAQRLRFCDNREEEVVVSGESLTMPAQRPCCCDDLQGLGTQLEPHNAIAAASFLRRRRALATPAQRPRCCDLLISRDAQGRAHLATPAHRLCRCDSLERWRDADDSEPATSEEQPTESRRDRVRRMHAERKERMSRDA